MWRIVRTLFLSFLLSFLNASHAQINLNQGLVAYYPFNGDAKDATANGHDGALHNGGPTLTTDRFGNPKSAYYFDGIDDYISVPDDGKFSTPQISFVAWFLTESNSLQSIVGKRKFEDDGTPSGGAQYQLIINYAPYPGITSNLVPNTASCTNASTSSYINTNEWVCANRWNLVVATFDGNRHKIYVNGILKRDVPTGFSSMLICNSEIRFGNWWSKDNIPFKGKIDDIRWYNRALTQDEVTALYANFNGTNSSASEFSFNQNICTPNQVTFTNYTQNVQSSSWSFGDGSTSTSLNPAHTYSNFGNYNIKLITRDSYGCTDSIGKQVQIGLSYSKLIATKDTTICKGQSVTLNTIVPGLNNCWSSSSGGLVNSNSSSIQVTPTVSTTYLLKSEIENTNLVVNGDFSAGNTSFTSEYNSAFPNTKESEYWVDNNPHSWNANFDACTEHTTGSGKMMMVNGSSVSGSKIWTQTINVVPNTNYSFSVWIESLAALNPANLKFSINNVIIGDNINAGNVACQWKKFYTIWNSGNLTSATITIVNNNTIRDGNDFAIDDISFSRADLVYDSVKINVADPALVKATGNASVCSGDSVQLLANGTAYYSWSPQNDLSNPSISNPIAKPVKTTTYVVTGYNTPGCTSKDSVTINVTPKPVFSVSPKAIQICDGTPYTISANGADSYEWYTSSGNFLGNNNSVSGIGNQSDTLFAILHNNLCSITDTLVTYIKVNQHPVVVVKKSNDVNCINPRAQLMATGGSTYSWTPATYISDPSIADPYVFPLTDTWYHVSVTNNNCTTEDSILVLSTIQAKGGGFYVPTAFTPNHDGKNDCFGVKFWGFAESFEMWIYDRGGQVLFHTKNLSDCWDGTYKGELQPSGTYVYQIKASSICSNGPVYRKGLFNLIR